MPHQAQQLLSLSVETAVEAGARIMEVYGLRDLQVQQKADDSPLTLADRRSHEAICKALAPTGIPVLSEEGRSIPYETRRQWTRFWLVDPLDGTKEFINRNGEFTVNIALVENGCPVMGVIYVPVADVLYAGQAGDRAIKKEHASRVTATGRWEGALELPAPPGPRPFTVVGSRSHMNAETAAFVESCTCGEGEYQVISRGSSLKFCMVAEGAADIYPRFGPTMEWDTGAGHAIAEAAGAVVSLPGGGALRYNKPDLLNPYFVVKR